METLKTLCQKLEEEAGKLKNITGSDLNSILRLIDNLKHCGECKNLGKGYMDACDLLLDKINSLEEKSILDERERQQLSEWERDRVVNRFKWHVLVETNKVKRRHPDVFCT